MAMLLVLAALLLPCFGSAHRDGGGIEEDNVHSNSSVQSANQSDAAAEGSTAVIANASVHTQLADVNATRFLPGLGSSLMQLSATSGLSATLQKLVSEQCKLNATGQSHDKVQELKKCAAALAELAEKTRTQHAISMKANQNYQDDMKLAKHLLMLLEGKAATQQQNFENFAKKEQAALKDLNEKLKSTNHAVQQSQTMSSGGRGGGSLIQSDLSRMQPTGHAMEPWYGDTRPGEPRFALRSRMVGAGIDAASLGPEVDFGDMRPSFRTLDREEAALESMDLIEDDRTSVGAGYGGGYWPEAPMRSRDPDWYW